MTRRTHTLNSGTSSAQLQLFHSGQGSQRSAAARRRRWDVAAYIEAMTELEPHLPAAEREELREWYDSRSRFSRDSDWPGWAKYLGQRPDADAKLRIVRQRRSA